MCPDDTLDEWRCQFSTDTIQPLSEDCDESANAFVVLKTVEGICSNENLDVVEIYGSLLKNTRSVVIFLEAAHIDLRSISINEAQPAKLRSKLSKFTEDGDDSSMDVYDGYTNRFHHI